MTNISGFVNIIKPTGMSSSDVVCKVKKILNNKKVGHLGTLDPAASGVLPIAFGKATKFFDYFLNKNKEYVAIVKFGIETDTLDSFGNITRKQTNCSVNEDILNETIKHFVGEITQIPPKYSALKINGEKACDLARNGVDFEIKSRNIKIFGIKILKRIAQDEYCFKVNCSAGTYIRTLFSDIAKEINMISTTTAIIRTKSGLFEINNAITLDELKESLKTISVGELFSKTERVNITDFVLQKKLINGVKLTKKELEIKTDKEFFIEIDGKIVGLYHYDDEKLICDVFLFEE